MCDRISVAHNAGLLFTSVLVVHQLALNVAGWCFDPFSFHNAFVLCVGLLSLVEVVCGRWSWPIWFVADRRNSLGWVHYHTGTKKMLSRGAILLKVVDGECEYDDISNITD